MAITITSFTVDGTLYEVRRTGPTTWQVYTAFGDVEYQANGELAQFDTAEQATTWAQVAHQDILDNVGE